MITTCKEKIIDKDFEKFAEAVTRQLFGTKCRHCSFERAQDRIISPYGTLKWIQVFSRLTGMSEASCLASCHSTMFSSDEMFLYDLRRLTTRDRAGLKLLHDEFLKNSNGKSHRLKYQRVPETPMRLTTFFSQISMSFNFTEMAS